MHTTVTEQLGAIALGDGRCAFRVWAPHADEVFVELVDGGQQHPARLQRAARGYHEGIVEAAPPGTRYYYRLGSGARRPDPASRLQPDGVHGPSEAIDPAFAWSDADWINPPLERHVMYELHVGAFTPEGTFEAVIPRLEALAALGVTAIELMPIAAFPGERNWGYDGVCLYAAQSSYGGVTGLRRLVDAAHAHGLAVILDVVYNHLGPEGNYLADFGPYFTDRHQTLWGPAINFDGPGSDEVRAFFIGNALYWVETCHIDGLRLDAVHAIVDHSSHAFLEALTDAVHETARRLDRRIHVIAESAANDPKLIRSRAQGGYGMDAQWNDDFHHALHALLTGERRGYYMDYGEMDQLAKSLTNGYVYTGEHSAYHGRPHGQPCDDVPASRFVVFGQNHDQVGNRMMGERLGSLVDFEACKLAAGVVLLSPFVPLLFMGEEYGEPAPFQYFVSHGETALIDAVRNGRRREFAAFGWPGDPPDPQATETFHRCRLDWPLRAKGPHRQLLEYYRTLLHLRRTVGALSACDRSRTTVETHEGECAIVMRRWAEASRVVVIFNFHDTASSLTLEPDESRPWRRLIDSGDPRWGGPGALSPPGIDGSQPAPVRVGAHAVVAFHGR